MKMKRKVTAMMAVLLLAVQLLSVQSVLAAEGVAKVDSLKVTATTAKSATISWAALKNVSGYEVYRSDAADGKYVQVKSIAAKKHVYTNSKLKAGTEYYYKVRAFEKVKKAKVYGAFTSVVTATTKQTEVEKAKTNVKVDLRKLAGAKYAVTANVPKGKKVVVLSTTQDKTGAVWCKVTYKHNGKEVKGYVAESQLTLTK